MLISSTGKSDRVYSKDRSFILNKSFSADRGFTLIEIIVVIVIISISAALIMPSFWDSGERALKSEAKRISNTLKYIHDEATGKKQQYLLKIDIDKNLWSYESANDSRSFRMQKDVIFRDIIVPSLGEVTAGEVTLAFKPYGPEDPVTFHLSKGIKEYTVMFNHISGRAKIYEGYKI